MKKKKKKGTKIISIKEYKKFLKGKLKRIPIKIKKGPRMIVRLSPAQRNVFP